MPLKLIITPVLFAFVCVPGITGCFPWPHFVTVVPEVNGEVVQSGRPVSLATILTRAATSGKPCDGTTMVAMTREDGTFTIPSQSEFRVFAVPLVDPLRVNPWELCIQQEGQTFPGLRDWNSQGWTGSIALSCDTDQHFPQEDLKQAVIYGACRVVSLGNFAGVKVSIPHDYSFYVHYRGERGQNSPPHTRPRSFASDIEELSISLHLPTLPPEVRSVWPHYLEYRGRPRHRPGDRSFQVTFSTEAYAKNRGQLKALLDQYMKGYTERNSQGGPFTVQDTGLHGLTQALTIQKEGRPTKPFVTMIDQVLYEPTTWQTVITCGTYRRNEPPFDSRSDCEHQFVVPDLNVLASIHYDEEDLSKWQEIEAVIKKMAQSIIVK